MIFGNKICKEVRKILGIPADEKITNAAIHFQYTTLIETKDEYLSKSKLTRKKQVIDFVQNFKKRQEEARKKEQLK